MRRIVSSVLLTNVKARLSPLKLTDDELRKLLPLMTTVWLEAPTTAEFGDSEVIDGTGLATELLTVKYKATDVAPDVSGLVAVTGNVPAVMMSEDGSTAVISVALTKLVARGTALKFAVARL